MDQEISVDLLQDLGAKHPEAYRRLWRSTQMAAVEHWLRADLRGELGNRGAQQVLLLMLNERFFLDQLKWCERLDVSADFPFEFTRCLKALVSGDVELGYDEFGKLPSYPAERSERMFEKWAEFVRLFFSHVPLMPVSVLRKEDHALIPYEIIISVSQNATLEDVKRAWPQVERMREALNMKREKAYLNFERDVRWYYLHLEGKSLREVGKIWAQENPSDFEADLRNYVDKTTEELKEPEEDFLRYVYPKTIAAAIRRFKNKIEGAYP